MASKQDWHDRIFVSIVLISLVLFALILLAIETAHPQDEPLYNCEIHKHIRWDETLVIILGDYEVYMCMRCIGDFLREHTGMVTELVEEET